MKFLAVAIASAVLAACAATETASPSTEAQPGTKRECVRRTGSNLCAKDDVGMLRAPAIAAAAS